MTANNHFTGIDEGEVRVSTAWDTLNVTLDGGGSWVDLSYETAHALADWIVANVPKPEPVPLPTKFGAVVKAADGFLWTHAEPHTDESWIAENGDWSTGGDIVFQGFEVIYGGVDD